MKLDDTSRVQAASGLTERDRAVVYALAALSSAKLSLLWMTVACFGYVTASTFVETTRYAHAGELACRVVFVALATLHAIRWLGAHLSYREQCEKVRMLDSLAKLATNVAYGKKPNGDA